MQVYVSGSNFGSGAYGSNVVFTSLSGNVTVCSAAHGGNLLMAPGLLWCSLDPLSELPVG